MITDVIVVLLVINGCVFFILGTVGIIRVPDAFCRLHPSTMCDTMGGGSVILAMMIYSGRFSDSLRLLLIGGFLFVSSAVCDHVIGRSLLKNNPDYTPTHSTSLHLLDWRKRK